MIRRPTSRVLLLAAPWVGLGVGLVAVLVHWPLWGRDVAISTGALVGLALALAWGHAAWRSSFGPRQWMAGAATVLVGLGVVASAVGAAVGVLSGSPMLGQGVALTGWATIIVASGVAAVLEWRALRNAGVGGAWWSSTVDGTRGRVGDPVGMPPQRRGGTAWLAAPLAVNLPWLWQGLGWREAQWLPVVLALLSIAAIWVSWSWIGPIAGRAWAVLAGESRHGRRFVHRDLALLEALRRGHVPAEPGPRHPRQPRDGRRDLPGAGGGSRPWRTLRTVFQVLAGLGIAGGITIGLFEVWPAFDQASRWDAYRRAELVVTRLDAGTQRAQWLGTGRIDGAEVIFNRGELDVLLGAPPRSRNDPRLQQVRTRLPMRAEVLWNPAAQRRLLPLDARREAVDDRARFVAGFAAALILPGALFAFLAHRLGVRRPGAGPSRPKR